MSTRVMDLVAEAVVDAFVSPKRRALSREEMKVRIADLHHSATKKKRRLKAYRAYRERWLQLTDEEIRDVVKIQLRERASAEASRRCHDRR